MAGRCERGEAFVLDFFLFFFFALWQCILFASSGTRRTWRCSISSNAFTERLTSPGPRDVEERSERESGAVCSASLFSVCPVRRGSLSTGMLESVNQPVTFASRKI